MRIFEFLLINLIIIIKVILFLVKRRETVIDSYFRKVVGLFPNNLNLAGVVLAHPQNSDVKTVTKLDKMT